MTRKKPPTQNGAQFITMWQALAGFATQSAGVGRAPSVGRKVESYVYIYRYTCIPAKLSAT